MFLVNGLKATLRQYNRVDDDNVFDDVNYQNIKIKICPYNIDNKVNFGKYTHPEATGYFQCPRWVDVQEGDQIIFNNKTYTILQVNEEWIFNRVENKVLAVK